jgi:hypothetical protein
MLVAPKRVKVFSPPWRASGGGNCELEKQRHIGQAQHNITRMKTQIPEQLKADVPQTTWGKILTATPVVMAVVSTMLAGLASSEMTKAQYDRSLAAQQQSKAGDQWSYFQAKKLRSALARNSIEVIRFSADAQSADASTLVKTQAGLSEKIAEFKQDVLGASSLPVSLTPQPVQAALSAIAAGKSETEIEALVKDVSEVQLDTCLKQSRIHAEEFDRTVANVTHSLDEAEKQLQSDRPIAHAWGLTRLELNAQRYEAEAKLNQAIGNILELQVRKSNISAERHHARSQKFFFGMLAAQAAVIISTFSLAAKKRSVLWSVAAIAGFAAIAFAVYVYLCM